MGFLANVLSFGAHSIILYGRGKVQVSTLCILNLYYNLFCVVTLQTLYQTVECYYCSQPNCWSDGQVLDKWASLGPLHKGLSLLIPHLNSSYPCTKPISIAHQTFLSPPCHKKSLCFVRGVAHSASSRLNVGVKCTHRLELALW